MLARGPREVVVASALPRADIGERRRAIHVMQPCLHAKADGRVVDRARDDDVDAADAIDSALKSRQVDPREVVDPDPKELANRGL